MKNHTVFAVIGFLYTISSSAQNPQPENPKLHFLSPNENPPIPDNVRDVLLKIEKFGSLEKKENYKTALGLSEKKSDFIYISPTDGGVGKIDLGDNFWVVYTPAFPALVGEISSIYIARHSDSSGYRNRLSPYWAGGALYRSFREELYDTNVYWAPMPTSATPAAK